jgi:hypothetical protein
VGVVGQTVIDLHEGVAEIFADAGERYDHDLRFDTELATSLRYEAAWIIEADLAPVVRRWRCTRCGTWIILRPGARLAVHLGSPSEILETGCGRMVKP